MCYFTLPTSNFQSRYDAKYSWTAHYVKKMTLYKSVKLDGPSGAGTMSTSETPKTAEWVLPLAFIKRNSQMAH